jgi:hypothetical protein
MICIDKNCENKGLLCHDCFINFPHFHMTSQIIPTHKFIEGSEKALTNAYELVSTSGELETSQIREEYFMNKKLLEKSKIYAENLVKKTFEALEGSLTTNYHETLHQFEGPKSNTLRDIDKSRAMLRELKDGIISDSQEVAEELSRLCKYIEQTNNKDNMFKITGHLISKTDPKPKEKKLAEFKKENRRLRNFLDKLNMWAEVIPNYSEEPARTSSPPKDIKPEPTPSPILINPKPHSDLFSKKAVLREVSPKKKDELARKFSDF